MHRFAIDIEVVGKHRETVTFDATCGVHARRIANKVKRLMFPDGVIVIHSAVRI